MNYLNINEKKLLPVVLELNILLADYTVYYQKLRAFHWNLLGKNFFDLHEMFEEMYNDAKVKVDDIAERILSLRHHPASLYREYLNMATVKETKPLIEDTEMVAELIKDHKTILTQMGIVIKHAEEAGDEGTIDLIGAYVRELEKATWMLNAWSKSTKDTLKTTMIHSVN